VLGRAFGFLLAVCLFGVFTVKGGYPDVLCIHYQEGVVHVEKEHPELPGDENELHVKLLPDASLKVCKLTPDEFADSRSFFDVIVFRHRGAILPSPKIPPPGKEHSLIKTVRLII